MFLFASVCVASLPTLSGILLAITNIYVSVWVSIFLPLASCLHKKAPFVPAFPLPSFDRSLPSKNHTHIWAGMCVAFLCHLFINLKTTLWFESACVLPFLYRLWNPTDHIKRFSSAFASPSLSRWSQIYEWHFTSRRCVRQTFFAHSRSFYWQRSHLCMRVRCIPSLARCHSIDKMFICVCVFMAFITNFSGTLQTTITLCWPVGHISSTASLHNVKENILSVGVSIVFLLQWTTQR